MFEGFADFDVTAGLLALAIAALLLWALQPLARRFDLLDHPKGRKSHDNPTPVTGGLAILAACLIAFHGIQAGSPRVLGFSVAALLLTAVGMLDDRFDLRWHWRILAQAAAALILVYWGGARVEQLGPMFGLDALALGWLSVPFTVFAVIGVINAVNMIDGADGLAGLLGLSALAMLLAAAAYSGNAPLVARLSVLCGALTGFLAWNLRLPWQPRAKVFLGNAGSALLGLVIAWASARLTQTPGHPVSPVLPLWLLAVPVLDCLVVSARRIRQGRSPFDADEGHIHHIMRAAGFGPTGTALCLAGFSLLCGLAAALALRSHLVSPVLMVAAYAALGVGWYLLSRDRQRAVACFRRLRRLVPGALPAQALTHEPRN